MLFFQFFNNSVALKNTKKIWPPQEKVEMTPLWLNVIKTNIRLSNLNGEKWSVGVAGCMNFYSTLYFLFFFLIWYCSLFIYFWPHLFNLHHRNSFGSTRLPNRISEKTIRPESALMFLSTWIWGQKLNVNGKVRIRTLLFICFVPKFSVD